MYKSSAFLEVSRLAVEFVTRAGVVRAVDDVSISLNKGDMLAIVGESGSGKSVTAYTLLGLLESNGKIVAGNIHFDGMALHKPSPALLRDIRGREISMIFQNPMSTLNPIRKIGQQISDMLRQHAQASKSTAPKKVKELLRQVEIKDVDRVSEAYPFELSGGMCQRVMIALALACKSRLLIADEPTTGLDVTTQKTIMDLVARLAKKENLAVMLITHDLGVAEHYCNKFVVMEKGNVVETADSRAIFSNPKHPYTRKLLAATPTYDKQLDHLTPEPPVDWGESLNIDDAPCLLSLRDLKKEYVLKTGAFKRGGNRFMAVDGVSFDIREGECVGLVGESGCGKSTTVKLIARLEKATAGQIIFDNNDLAALDDRKFKEGQYRKQIQMVFQDPTGCLNPRHSVFQLIAEPLKRLGGISNERELWHRAIQLCRDVGLPEELIERLPHQLSGGQKARVGIARAIAVKPKLLILDEPTTALDVSVQALVLQLLERLRRKYRLSYLFVSHDLNVVRMLSQRVVVMEKGKIVETGDTQAVLSNPSHPFTFKLVKAIPQLAKSP